MNPGLKKLLLLFLFANCFLPIANSQAPQSWTSAEMYQAIRKLNVLGSVLYLAAHPDDENTRLIAYLSKDKLYRTGYLSMTRGDGGQNLIGDDQGIDLGLIRTQELLSARRIDGGEQFFTRAFDFGYSKNPEETFTKWDKEKILSDVVWVIRKFQPDVIITRFPTTGEGGHGHHTASAILASEAFAEAADPNRFPEQLNYVSVWQTKRVLWNSFVNNTNREGLLKIDVGGYNPLLGKSYGEIAAESRSQHKSQGFGVAAGRGEALEYFQAVKGDQPSGELLDGINPTWVRVPGGQAIEKIVDSLASSFDFLNPERSVKGLVRLYRSLESMPGGYWRNKKLQEVKELIVQCSGLFLDVTTPEQFAVQTDSLRINLVANNRLGSAMILKEYSIVGFDTVFNQTLSKNRNYLLARTSFISNEQKPTQPYWLAEKKAEGYYNVSNPLLIGIPDVEPALIARLKLNIEGADINFEKPIRYKFTDPVQGELYEPLVILPTILLTPDENMKTSINSNKFNGVLKFITKSKRTDLGVKNVAVGQPDAGKFNTVPNSLSLSERNREYEMNYKIDGEKDHEYQFLITDGQVRSSTAGTNGNDPAKYQYAGSSLREIKYGHIPYINYFVPAQVMNVRVNLEIYNKKIGYIPGAGDKIPEALEQMGFDVNRLTEKELSQNKLDKFDAIITGVRAYNTNEWLNKHYDKLMKYVQEGGNLIVQYNTSNNIGPVRAKIAPYNFNISRNRVTDENAEVKILKPDHPVFNFPNKITQDDFKGWIQERSIYHAEKWDSTKFETVLAMHDPGENPDEGALIISKYGKGTFVYTGLVFFRELPAGVAGAYRFLANIIALNRKKGF